MPIWNISSFKSSSFKLVIAWSICSAVNCDCSVLSSPNIWDVSCIIELILFNIIVSFFNVSSICTAVSLNSIFVTDKTYVTEPSAFSSLENLSSVNLSNAGITYCSTICVFSSSVNFKDWISLNSILFGMLLTSVTPNFWANSCKLLFSKAM